MQIPGAAENAHLYQRQCLTGRAAHAAAPCRPNAAQHFKSPGESPAACFKMQLLFCLCILRVLCGLCTIQPGSFPAISEEFLCFRHIRNLCRQRKTTPFRVNFSLDPGRTKNVHPAERFFVSWEDVSDDTKKKGNVIPAQFSPGFRQNKKRSLTFLPG